MALVVTLRELGFPLVDPGDGTLLVDGIRVTAESGWIHLVFDSSLIDFPAGLPLRVALRPAFGGEDPTAEIHSSLDSPLEDARLLIVAALQSEIARRIARARGPHAFVPGRFA